MLMLTGAQIKELREAIGMNTTQLAARLGVTENAVRRWELGDRHPRWDTMVELNKMREKAQREGKLPIPA
jgi:DNA-binding transcriptional regulator YiaG